MENPVTDDYVISPQDQELEELRGLDKSLGEAKEVQVLVDGSLQSLPIAAATALQRVVRYLCDDAGVAIQPFRQQISTQEAADLLGISRTHFVTLLNQGVFDYERLEGKRTHRRIPLRAVLNYRQRLAADASLRVKAENLERQDAAATPAVAMETIRT